MGRGHGFDSGGIQGLEKNEMETGELAQSINDIKDF